MKAHRGIHALEGPASNTPTVAGHVLVRGDGDGAVVEAQAKVYRSAHTLIFLMQCKD